MWRWIAKEIRKDAEQDVEELKEQWIEKHAKDELVFNCYFCDRNDSLGGDATTDCSYCPGLKIDKEFDCNSKEYNFEFHPIAFYNKLRALNRKRLAKKESKK